MAPVFIFARQIQEIIRSGKKEIEIPDGARISAAAADLIKANKIKVLSAPPGAAAATGAPCCMNFRKTGGSLRWL